MTVENERLQGLGGGQRRETINTRQRFDLFRDAKARADGYRGSMVFATVNGGDYLLRSFYDPRTGHRRQTSLGPRSPSTERLKGEFDAGRGFPLRMVAPDPRAFAVHKLWMSRRADRDPLKAMRDAAQARAVATLVARHMPHLPFRLEELRSFPREVVAEASALFALERSPDSRFDG